METVGSIYVIEKKVCNWLHSSPRTLIITYVQKQDYLVHRVGAQQWHLAIGSQFWKQDFIASLMGCGLGEVGNLCIP